MGEGEKFISPAGESDVRADELRVRRY